MKGNVIGYVKVLEMLPRKKLITSKADWILRGNAKKTAQVCSKGWEPRQAEESWCYISRNGELEKWTRQSLERMPMDRREARQGMVRGDPGNHRFMETKGRQYFRKTE